VNFAVGSRTTFVAFLRELDQLLSEPPVSGWPRQYPLESVQLGIPHVPTADVYGWCLSPGLWVWSSSFPSPTSQSAGARKLDISAIRSIINVD
jgi:hypothetical protein